MGLLVRQDRRAPRRARD